jgi:hypothetical protein
MDRPSRPLSLGFWILLALVLAALAVVRHPSTPMAAASHEAAAVPTPWWPPMTSAPTTTVAAAPTTTVPAPPPPPVTTPPPTAAPPPAPSTTTAPVPPPVTTTVAAAAPSPSDPVAYAMSLVRAVVPARWLAAVPVQVEVIPGQTSWSSWGGLIEIGDWHLFHTESRARFTLAHEWGHQAAWAFGPDTYDGEPPRGFPYRGAAPEEQWGDCVGEVLTGSSYPSSGLGGCPSDARSFTAAWLAAGPP